MVIETINSLIKNQSTCDGGIDVNDHEVENLLLQNKGGFGKEPITSSNRRLVVTVKWNKEEMFFACSIAFLKKQEGKWHCDGRFDDAHNCRHFDADFDFGKSKMFDGRFAEIKAECPVLFKIIESLPKDKADVWKIKNIQ